MKKNKGNKKKKARKKWSKQFGDFTLKHPVFSTIGKDGVKIDLYYKDELIGFAMDSPRSNKKQEYSLSIYDINNNGYIGDAICKNQIHNLPKALLDVRLKGNSILSPEREVLFEKYKAPEIKLSTPTRIMILPRR